MDYKNLKKTLKSHFIQTIIIYLFVYLSYTFINWELVNPFQWILNIPLNEDSDRIMILMTFLTYNGVGVFMRYNVTKPKN